MEIELTSILLFILGLFYLIVLPGFLILSGLKIRNLGVIEKLTASFGVGVGVLTLISISLSLTGSFGLTAFNLVLANGIVLVVLCLVFYVNAKRNNQRKDLKS